MSPEIPSVLDTAARERLLAVARATIGDGVAGREPVAPRPADHPPALCVPAATFVTLNCNGALRGCVGTLEAREPLVVDAARNAHAAAFHDPRFAPLTRSEFETLDIQVSILSAAEPLAFAGEEELMRQLRPGIDGLILSEAGRRGTFLPAVWASIPEPRAFLAELKLKTGLAPDYWSDTIEVLRYTTVSIP